MPAAGRRRGPAGRRREPRCQRHPRRRRARQRRVTGCSRTWSSPPQPGRPGRSCRRRARQEGSACGVERVDPPEHGAPRPGGGSRGDRLDLTGMPAGSRWAPLWHAARVRPFLPLTNDGPVDRVATRPDGAPCRHGVRHPARPGHHPHAVLAPCLHLSCRLHARAAHPGVPRWPSGLKQVGTRALMTSEPRLSMAEARPGTGRLMADA